jgi:formylmethanofuran dehydrogenase subunit E-like metal-binding protein
MGYFYCEFFHISFIVVQAQGALRLITSEPTWANNDFTNLLHREIIKRGQDCILSYLGQAVKLAAWSLLLVTFFFHNFFWPSVMSGWIFCAYPCFTLRFPVTLDPGSAG